MKQKIYLASPFFDETQRKNMETVLWKLRSSGYSVFAPYEFVIPDSWSISNKKWGKMIFNGDVEEIDKCDIVVAINYGMDSDSGTAWETGYAYAKGKPVYNVCFKDTVNSLMMINGAKGTLYIEDVISKDVLNLEDYKDKYINEEQK
jgi:Nucleoside 2-deoxyribosyltransferase